jgi:hypothetical protein
MLKELHELVHRLNEQEIRQICDNLPKLAEISAVLTVPLEELQYQIRRCPHCRRHAVLSPFFRFLVSIEWSAETLGNLREWYGGAVADFAAAVYVPDRTPEAQLQELSPDRIPVLGQTVSTPVVSVQSASAGVDFPRPSCPQCVLKHLADAGILMIEALHGYPIHRGWAIGNLSQAEQECYAMSPEFAADIRAIRLKIMTEPEFVPDFNPLLERALELAGLSTSAPAVTVLTVTRDRPALFRLHERMLEQQTLQNFQWIVVDDGQTPAAPARKCTLVQRPYEPSKRFTHRENLLAGLAEWRGGILVFMEDDDFYPPEYLEQTVRLARSCTGLFGWKNPFYYWPREKHREINSRTDLCITAFSGCHYRHRERLIDIIRSCRSNFVDVDLWRQMSDRTMRDYPGAPVPVGIKGISGNGFSREHRKTFSNTDGGVETWFREQVGEIFFAKYQNMMENTSATQKG